MHESVSLLADTVEKAKYGLIHIGTGQIPYQFAKRCLPHELKERFSARDNLELFQKLRSQGE